MWKEFKQLFRRDAAEYTRNINVLDHYVQLGAAFVAKSRGITLEDATAFIKKNLRPGGRFEFKDPLVDYLERQPNGDRERKRSTLTKYLGDVVRKGRILAPTFTVYANPKTELESFIARYVDNNIKLRGLAKKAYFAARAAGQKILEQVKKIEQTGRKLANNAISGAHVSASQPLHNKTAHSTLTSTCRTTSGYGNANNEKFLAGNRHYFDLNITLNNLITTVNNVDYDKIRAVMTKFNLAVPSVDDVMRVVKRSSSQYWHDDAAMLQIHNYVVKLNDEERAAVCYVGDMWHLMQLNPEFMRKFLTDLSRRVEGVHENPMALIKSAPDDYVNFGHQLCMKETMGIGKDYSKIADKPAIHTLALTIEHIAQVLEDYTDLFSALWVTSNLPASVANFPSSIRQTVLASDTDSTIFTVQDWVIWYSGRAAFDEQSMGVYAAVVFLTSATITHVLATMSANFGVVPEKLFRIEMKSEFMFPVFTPTNLGKHYYAIKTVQEGNVFEEPEPETKGAQLKNANVPREIILEADSMMADIIATVMSEKKIKLTEYLKRVADVERAIIEDIRQGGLRYLRNSSIKDAGSYAGEKEESPFQHHFLWQEVFAPKYGTMPEPPYNTKKYSTTLDSPSKVKAWLAGMADKDLAERMRAYMQRNGKRDINTFYIPTDILLSTGLPVEIEQVINYDRIVIDICGCYYILLETLGYYALGDTVKRLVSKSGF